MATYTDEERRLILKKSKELRAQGRTLEGFKLVDRMERGDNIQLWEYSDAPRPETNISAVGLKPPPIMGRGSSTEAWRSFAMRVLDIEPETIAAFDRRQDIVQLLVDRGVIDQPESPFEPPYEKADHAD